MYKDFLEKNGQFIIEIPIEWSYKNPEFDSDENAALSFELYEKPIGCFQISSISKTIGNVPNLIQNKNLAIQEIGKNNIVFSESFIPSIKYDVFLWMALIGDSFVMCKYIYDTAKRESADIKTEIEKAKKALETLMFLKEEDKAAFIGSDRVDKFLGSLMASEDLTNRAFKNASSIELVILLANQIDAILRLSIILDFQLKNKTFEIDLQLLYQGDDDKPIMEKKVYERALKENVIDKTFFDELFNLYNERNKVVHRFIITDIKTKDLASIVYEYDCVKKKASDILNQLELNQFDQKIGIYGLQHSPDTPMDQSTFKRLIAFVKDKHAHKIINEGVTFKADI